MISPTDAEKLIFAADTQARPIVLDTRGGYKDYFRGHIPTAHHVNFDTLRGTDNGIPVQYLPDDLTSALLVRAGIQTGRTHLIHATGDTLPNDEILSATKVAYVLEKFGVDDIRIIDGGLAGWTSAGLPVTQEYFGNPPGTVPSKRKPEIGIGIDELLKLKDRAEEFDVIEALLLLSAAFVAFTNGANANCKGVASLYGTGTTSLQIALRLGAATTFMGSVCAVFLSGGMLRAFSGQGFASSLVTAGLVTTASLHSMPASTTHVSVGSLIGMGASTHQARWRKIMEIMIAWIMHRPLRCLLRRNILLDLPGSLMAKMRPDCHYDVETAV